VRQRKPKNLTEKLKANEAFCVNDPERIKGNWRMEFRRRLVDRTGGYVGESAYFGDGSGGMVSGSDGMVGGAGGIVGGAGGIVGGAGGMVGEPCSLEYKSDDSTGISTDALKLYLEIGSGKGKFLLAKASSDKSGLYIGFEGRDSILLRALEKTSKAGLNNLLFSRFHVHDLLPIFADCELDGIFLNFCDPWPKERHSERRLTSPGYLKMYERILKPGGFVEFKTDSYDFFRYSFDTISSNADFKIETISEDLHNKHNQINKPFETVISAENTVSPTMNITDAISEYEEKFIRWNRQIYYIRTIKT